MTTDHTPAPQAHGARTTPFLGWYGDDFTGATDTLSALAFAHWRGLLFLGVPTASQLSAAGPLDAVGIAGAARSMDPAAMQAELEPVGRFFAQLCVPVLHYKVCSTFDSAPGVGSIGVAVRALRAHVASAFVPIVGGQPNIGRYCAFSNLFAAAGIAGAVHRIDRHPTMSRHPVTPMGEGDLRRHLAAQGLADIAAFHYPLYDRDAATQDAALEAMLAGATAGNGGAIAPVLFDVVRAADLRPLGRLLWERAQRQRLLAVGGSSVVQALAAWLASTGEGTPFAPPRMTAAEGPVFVLSGSMSPVTARQVGAASAYERIAIDVARLLVQPDGAGTIVGQVIASLRAGRNVLVHTQSSTGADTDTKHAAQVAQVTARLVAEVVRQMEACTPLRRVGIAGGDTSSHVAQALGLWGLGYRTTLAPGVTLSVAHSASPARHGMELMFKGGQMGEDDLFNRLVQGD